MLTEQASRPANPDVVWIEGDMPLVLGLQCDCGQLGGSVAAGGAALWKASSNWRVERRLKLADRPRPSPGHAESFAYPVGTCVVEGQTAERKRIAPNVRARLSRPLRPDAAEIYYYLDSSTSRDFRQVGGIMSIALASIAQHAAVSSDPPPPTHTHTHVNLRQHAAVPMARPT